MKKTLFALAVIGGLASCKKSDNPANSCSASSTSIAGTYKISAIKYKANASAGETDLFSDLQDCQKDDTYQLAADGSIVITDAGVSCGMPPSPGSVNGWRLDNNNTILNMDDVQYKIESFNCTSLVLSVSDLLEPGDKKTTTYLKQ